MNASHLPATKNLAITVALAGIAGLNGPASAERLVLEEIIVTAQKRPENVQDIPLTVNVIDGTLLDDFSIRDTNDLGNSIPGLTIQHTPQNLSQVTIRGLGTGAGGESVDQSVGLFIDGVWAGRIREFQTSLFDVERVEVIKGTQTTLLGKNTSLGAISILSRRPGDEFGGYVQGDYEFEYESVYTSGAVDIPSGFGNYRLAFNYVDEGGYVDNSTTGNEVPEREQTTLRASGSWDVGDNGSLLLLYQWDDLEIKGDTFQPDDDEDGFLQTMDPTADIGVDKNKAAFTSYSDDGDADDEQDSQRAIIEYARSIGEFTLVALSGWTEYDNDRLTDSDFLSADYLTTTYDSDYEQFSQEVRIASPTSGRFDYVAGLFYLDSDMDYSSDTLASFEPPFTVGGLPVDSDTRVNYDQDTEVWSAFGQGTFHITDEWRTTVGLRYTDEEKDATWGRERLRLGSPQAAVIADLIAPAIEPTDLNREEDNLDWSLNLQWDATEQLMAFASYAVGSKSGGFAIGVVRPEEAEYETEEAETYELGFKSTLAGGAAIFNASVFYTEISDFQVITFVGDRFLVETIPAESQGLELEGFLAVTERLTFGASATYAESEEKDTDFTLPYAPQWSASFNARYEHPWTSAGLMWRVEGVLNYRDKQYQQRLERSLDGELTLLDLRVALTPTDDRWEVALIGRNLLDQASSFGFDFPFWGGGEFPEAVPQGSATIGSLNRPLTVALQARYNF